MMHSKSTSTERREHTAVIYGPLNLLLQSQNIYSVTWLLMNISLCICSSTDLKTSIHISIFRETERERMKQNATKPTKKHLIKTESFKAHSTTHLTVLQSVSFLSVLILSLFSVCVNWWIWVRFGRISTAGESTHGRKYFWAWIISKHHYFLSHFSNVCMCEHFICSFLLLEYYICDCGLLSSSFYS